MMNLPTPTLNLAVFYAIADNLDQETAEHIACAFPDLFKTAFVYSATAAKSDPPKPLAKTKSTVTEPTVSADALKKACLDYVTAHPRSKSEEVAAALGQPGAAVKKALEVLVDVKVLSCEGERRGRKYNLMTPRADESEAAE